MKYLRCYLYFCILCISVMSCTSTPTTGALYFPITVLAGVADLTVSMAGDIHKYHLTESCFWINHKEQSTRVPSKNYTLSF